MAPTGNNNDATPSFRILSIDGGGIRGIIPGQILVVLEKMLQEESGNSDARIADYFDLIAGTSTGGILTCIYLAPQVGANKSRYSAQQAVNLYIEHGKDVFDLTVWQKIISGKGLADEKYSSAGLEAQLVEYFGDLRLKDLRKPCLITAYDIHNSTPFFFAQHKARDTDMGEAEDFFVRDVARATSAAPTFFEAARIESGTKVHYPLIDGGLFANNPALCAYVEARKLNAENTAKDLLILSLGTGQTKVRYEYNKAKDWGMMAWVKPVLEIMMSGVSATVHAQLEKIYEAIGRPKQYLRISPDLETKHAAMDNAKEDNIAALREAGQKAAQDNRDALRQFAKRLTEVKDVG